MGKGVRRFVRHVLKFQLLPVGLASALVKPLSIESGSESRVRLSQAPLLLSSLESSSLLKRGTGQRLGELGRGTAWTQGTVRGRHRRHISQLVSTSGASSSKRTVLLDTLALVRTLESQGLTANQAEAITAVLTEVLNESLYNISQSFAVKAEVQKNEMMQEAALLKLKGDIQSLQDHKVSSLQRGAEKLKTDIDKMRSEMRYEIDKVTASQRLDLNLERGRTREELANQSVETSNLTNKLDREIHSLKTQLEAAKYEVIKYCIGTIVSVTAVGLGLLRIFM
eukprot:c23398_g1_i1 orf=249-1094(-)